MSVDISNSNSIDINEFKMAKLMLIQEDENEITIELSAM